MSEFNGSHPPHVESIYMQAAQQYDSLPKGGQINDIHMGVYALPVEATSPSPAIYASEAAHQTYIGPSQEINMHHEHMQKSINGLVARSLAEHLNDK